MMAGPLGAPALHVLELFVEQMATQLCRHVHVKVTLVRQTPTHKTHLIFDTGPLSLSAVPAFISLSLLLYGSHCFTVSSQT